MNSQIIGTGSQGLAGGIPLLPVVHPTRTGGTGRVPRRARLLDRARQQL